jgi:hypothetical protein
MKPRRIAALLASLIVVIAALPPAPTLAAQTPPVATAAAGATPPVAQATPVRWEPPTVRLTTYTGKPTHTFGFAGSGFAPGEQVDVYFGSTHGPPLATVQADAQGNLAVEDRSIPQMDPGDYTLSFVGHDSDTLISVGFNVQGFHPWAVLDNYAPPPHYGMGFSGQDFVPGEVVDVYLNGRQTQPVAQVTADANGQIVQRNAFTLPDLRGDNQVLFVGEQSHDEITATFAAMTATNP